jgi:putative transposase
VDKPNVSVRRPTQRAGGAGTDSDVDSSEWQEARERMADVRTIVGDGGVSAAAVNVLAARWNVSRATVWRRIHRYRRDGGLRAFLSQPRGVRPGAKNLESVVEAIIQDAARSWWRKTENATIAEILPTVVATCSGRAIPAPSRATVSRRLAILRSDPANFSGEVRASLRERRRLLKSSYTVTKSLAVVQIDHTVADVFIVDPISRQCIGRPTLTVGIDVATRSVLGFCLSLEAPSALLVALCLEHAAFPKLDWLASVGIDVDWPAHGLPIAIHCDNGREFHSAAFRRGCDLNGIDTIYRPPGTPRFGGHVERLIGTLMRRVRLLPGSSYSDLLGARPTRAETRAALTLADLRGFLVEDISRYHARSHRALGISPRHAWDLAWSQAATAPRVPTDPIKFRCEFLPLRRRVIGREGIELFRLKYSAESLVPEVALGRQRVVRFDPRDLSHVYLERDGEGPLRVPLRDPQIPALSVWEWEALGRTRRELIERGDGECINQHIRAATLPTLAAPTPLKSRRRAARAAAWREVQAIAALPTPDVVLEPTLSSCDAAGTFSWEVLE